MKKMFAMKKSQLGIFSCMLFFLLTTASVMKPVWAGEIQNLKETDVTVSVKAGTLESAIREIQKVTKISFAYDKQLLTAYRVENVSFVKEKLGNVLSTLLQNKALGYVEVNKVIVIKRDETPKVFFAKANTPDAVDDVVITGTVTDENDKPLAGVTVSETGTNNMTSTDQNGHYKIPVTSAEGELVFTFIGYTTAQQKIAGRNAVNVKMAPGADKQLQDVVVVGYGRQKKVNLTGAVSAVTAKDIVTTKNENVQNMLTGKVPGLRVVQNTSEPGTFSNNFDIRGLGTPLIVIDGVPRDNVSQIDPNDIESVSVLKDASAAVYGVRAANGVVLITTKKGKSGAIELTYSGNWGWQKMNGMPKPVDAISYMTLVNEQNMHNANGGRLVYSDDDINAYKNGTKQTTDWFGATLKNTAPENQQNMTVTGGNDKTHYFLSFGYTSQDGFFKSNDLNYKRYNVRSNITSKITKDLTVDLNLNGIVDQKNQPYQSSVWIFRTLWGMVPTDPIYANNNPNYLFKPAPEGDNPVAMSNKDISGYQVFKNNWFQSSLALHYDVPHVEGLRLNGLFSYDFNSSDNKIYKKMYYEYTYDAAADKYNPTSYNSPTNVRREYYSKPSSLLQASVTYDRTFGGHSVSGLVLVEQSVRNYDNFYGQRDLSLNIDQLGSGNSLNQQTNVADAGQVYKNANHGIVGRVNYGFKGKYLAEFSFREDGSSKFPPENRWGFFPSASVGWRVSEENFFKSSDALSFINNLKIRGSYGKLGDDASANNGVPVAPGYYYPATGDYNKQPGGSVFDGNFVNATQSTGIPNPNLTWYVSKTADIGIDVEAWKGLLGITADVFQRDRTGLLATRAGSLPDVLGAPLPQENLNSDRSQGIDLQITHRNKIGKFNYFVNAIFGYTRTKNIYNETAVAGNSWDNWKNNQNGRFNSIWWGLGANGQYQSYEDIINSPVFVDRNVVPGDYNYEDWNGDGQINDLDRHPIAYQQQPLINYGLTLGGSYKNVDFNILLQGANLSNVSYIEQLRIPLWGGRSALDQFMDRWHPLDPKADPYDPNTQWVSGNYAYTGVQPDENSLYNIQNSSYLRLKSVEIGYTFSARLLSPIGIKNIRVYANGYNLVTITKLKYMDPEHPSSSWGYLYPLNKVFNVGLTVKF